MAANDKLDAFKEKVGKEASFQEKIETIPKFKEDDWKEPLLYVHFALNYYDEEIFKVILRQVKNFESNSKLFAIFSRKGAYGVLTQEEPGLVNLDRVKLNQMAFEASIDRDYMNIAEHFILTSSDSEVAH